MTSRGEHALIEVGSRAYALALDIVTGREFRKMTAEEAIAKYVPYIVEFITGSPDPELAIEMVERLAKNYPNSKPTMFIPLAEMIFLMTDPAPEKIKVEPSAVPAPDGGGVDNPDKPETEEAPSKPPAAQRKAPRKKAPRKKTVG